MKEKFPVGCEFKGTATSGRIVTIWRDNDSRYSFQVWRWSAVFSDGSGHDFDWGTSYSAVRKRIPPIVGKMRRVK